MRRNAKPNFVTFLKERRRSFI